MSDVNDAIAPKQIAQRDQIDQNHAAVLTAHAHKLMAECHVHNPNAHAADWWKKAHASAIQAMPEQIKCHDSVKGQVGTTLWDVAHASLESRGQKGSVAHEMKRIADINHISVDCNDLRGKEIRLHEHHAKPVEAPCPPVAHVPVPQERPHAPCPPKVEHHPKPSHPVDQIPCPPEPARRPQEFPQAPQVHTAPPPPERYENYPPPPPPLPPRESYDVPGYRRVEPCHQPNIMDLFNPLGIGRDNDCRMPPPPPPEGYYHRGPRYGYGDQGAIGGGIGLNLLGGLLLGRERRHERERYQGYQDYQDYQSYQPQPHRYYQMKR